MLLPRATPDRLLDSDPAPDPRRAETVEVVHADRRPDGTRVLQRRDERD